MKLNDWAKREDLQLEWKQIWETNETFKAGFEVLRDSALPSETKPPGNADLIQHNAMMNARREGYYDALRNIEALKEIRLRQEPLPEPWSQVKKED